MFLNLQMVWENVEYYNWDLWGHTGTTLQNPLDETDAVTKCEHLKAPAPFWWLLSVPVSEAQHPGQYSGCPYFPACVSKCFGQAATDFQSLPTEENPSESQR